MNMNCKNCGELLEENTKFCTSCGASISDDAVVTEEVSMETEETLEVSEPVVTETNTEDVVLETEAVEEVAPVVEEIVTPEVKETEEVVTNELVESEAHEEAKEELMRRINKSKKSKTKLCIGIAVLVVLLLCGACYFYEFKTADMRITKFLDKAFNFTEVVKDEDLKASGNYTIDGSLEANGQAIKLAMEGSYGVDLEKEILNYGLKLKELSFEDQNLFTESMDFNLAVNSDTIGVYVSSLYDKYITYTDPSIKEMFKRDDKETNVSAELVDGLMDALKDGIKAMDKKQNVKSVEINGEKIKANVVSMNMDTANTKKFVKALMVSIKDNDSLFEELKKISSEDMSKEEFKKSLEESIKAIDESEEEFETGIVIEIGTSIVKGDFKFIRIYSEDVLNITVSKIKDGYKAILSADGSTIAIDVTSTKKDSKDTKDSTAKLVVEITNEDEDNSVKLTVNITNKADKKPVVEKIDTKNSISFDKLTENDQEKIMSNIENSMLGSLITSAGGMTGGLDVIETSGENAAESSMLSYVDAIEKEIVTELMKDAASSTNNYNYTYIVDGSNLTSKFAGVKQAPCKNKTTLALENYKANNECDLDTQIVNNYYASLNVSVTNKPVNDVRNTVVVSDNVVSEAKAKFDDYYVSYYYNKLTGKTTYCASKDRFLSQFECE